MATNPRVSVVTTVYNGKAYVDCAVPSILAQDYDDFEWVIVDDGSTDDTPRFLEELANRDSRVCIHFPGRLGRVKALNYALNVARGEYVAQQDFDDISYPGRLSAQARFLDKNSTVGVVGAAYLLVDENRGEQYIRRPATTHDELVHRLARYIPLAHTLVMYRKQAWKEAGGYSDMEDIEDLKLWIDMAAAGWRLAALEDVLGEHRVHPRSYWHTQFRYAARQRTLAGVQAYAIRRLGLPRWMYIYPLARLIYPYLPRPVKRAVRRTVGGMDEEDVG